jgi:V/A-type H+-transporting ATPase subunit E
MKRTLETGNEKIHNICTLLKKETLEPAQEESKRIIEEAHQRAKEIVQEARSQAEALIQEAHNAMAQERSVFQSSLNQAAKQSVEMLRQSIEKHLFNPELHAQIVQHTSHPQVVAHFVSAIINSLDKEGLAVDLVALVPKTVAVKEVNQLLMAQILEKLKGRSVVLGDFEGGVKVRVENKKMVLDISDSEIKELLDRYIRKGFRQHMFGV